jgi:hypothetical protein
VRRPCAGARRGVRCAWALRRRNVAVLSKPWGPVINARTPPWEGARGDPGFARLSEALAGAPNGGLDALPAGGESPLESNMVRGMDPDHLAGQAAGVPSRFRHGARRLPRTPPSPAPQPARLALSLRPVASVPSPGQPPSAARPPALSSWRRFSCQRASGPVWPLRPSLSSAPPPSRANVAFLSKPAAS